MNTSATSDFIAAGRQKCEAVMDLGDALRKGSHIQCYWGAVEGGVWSTGRGIYN